MAAAVYPGALEICDGWANDCGAVDSAEPFLPNGTQAEYGDEYDDDADGYVECDTWSAGGASNDQELQGGADCADVAGVPVGVPSDVLDSIFPGAPELCDGWDNGCVTLNAPFAGEHSPEWDDDGDQYIECSPFVALGQVNAAGEPILGGEDCLDEETVHAATGLSMPLSVAAEVHPGAAEVCDGLNTDCSAPLEPETYLPEDPSEADADADGYMLCDASSDPPSTPDPPPSLVDGLLRGDCDDAVASINPGAFDDFSDSLVDNDCDLTEDEESIAFGHVTINEIAASPVAGDLGRWFEVRNNAGSSINLNTWTLLDAESDPQTILEDIIVAPGGFAVLCKQSASALISCNSADDWDADFDFARLDGGISLQVGNRQSGPLLVDQVAWSSELGADGIAAGFNPALLGAPADIASANDQTSDSDGDPSTFGNWCQGRLPDSSGTLGSPGAPNPSCDALAQDADGDGFCQAGVDLNIDGDCDDAGEGQAEATAQSQCGGAICDCDDGNEDVGPLMVEICDGYDTDCSRDLASNLAEDPLETDDDFDGYIECTAVLSQLNPLHTGGDDCDDTDASVSPGAPELCDGLDNDCDGLANYVDPVLGGELDEDGDGFSPCLDGDCLDSAAPLLALG